MASSFIDTFQNLANSISSATNGFTWDNAIRKFQYAIAGITLGALAIFESTNPMQCSVASQSFPEYYFASSYCFESTWYYVEDSGNSTTVKYDDSLRYFKWYILIPPLMTIIVSVLYGAVVNGFIIQSIKFASNIASTVGGKGEESSPTESTTVIDKNIEDMAMRARLFSETHLHMNKKRSFCSCFNLSRRKCSPMYSSTEDCDQTELVQVSSRNDAVRFTSSSRLGENTFIFYHLYLFLCFVINGVAVGFINPYFFWLPNQIACRYRKEDLSIQWSICSVPGYRYFRVAVLIVMTTYALGVLVSVLSLLYLNVFLPLKIRGAGAAISAYTRDPKQQEKLAQCLAKYGKDRIGNLTSTSRFLLALIYQNLDRTLCFRLVLALIDIEKDREAIDSHLPRMIKEIVRLDMEAPALINDEKEALISEIREMIMNPVGIDQAKKNIENNVLMHLVKTFLSNPQNVTVLFQAQQVHRITGVQMPNISSKIKQKFVSLLLESKESDFDNSVLYTKFLGAVYDLTKVRDFFTLLESSEIGQLIGLETSDHISDNGHEVVAGQHYDGRRAFDSSGYCWRSSDATAYNWIRRAWDQDHVIKLIALQGSHVNSKSTPIRFNFTAKMGSGDDKEGSWVQVSETYRSFDWLEDEWRVFPVYVVEKESSSLAHPRTKCIQINIFDNDGAEYFEVQKIKIYGSTV